MLVVSVIESKGGVSDLSEILHFRSAGILPQSLECMQKMQKQQYSLNS
jgi:hypothetical protein